MERTPFEWSQPVERERETPRVQGRIPTGKPALGQPFVWATPKPRYDDDTPKMGRMGTAAFLAFLVVLAFGAVWVIERDVEGPAASEPLPQTAALDSQTSNIDDAPTPSVAQEPPPVIGSTEPPPPVNSEEATRPTSKPQITPDLQARLADWPIPPLSQRPEATRIPFPTEPPLSQRVQPATLEPAPAPPRAALAEAVPGPLPRVAVEDPALTPPVTPPPEPPPAPTPTVAPAPAPAAAPAPAPAADVDNSAIRGTLDRYRTAFNALDAKAAHQVWPSVNERTLDRAFGQLQQQNVSFDRCTIAVKGVIAEANCSGTTRFVPRVGNRSEQIEPRQWNFSLRKAHSGGWLIQEVEAR